MYSLHLTYSIMVEFHCICYILTVVTISFFLTLGLLLLYWLPFMTSVIMSYVAITFLNCHLTYYLNTIGLCFQLLSVIGLPCSIRYVRWLTWFGGIPVSTSHTWNKAWILKFIICCREFSYLCVNPNKQWMTMSVGVIKLVYYGYSEMYVFKGCTVCQCYIQ